MINPRVTAYIKVNLKKGFTEEEITKSLKGGGWNEQDIIDSFAHVKDNDNSDNSEPKSESKVDKPKSVNYPFILSMITLLILFAGVGSGFYLYFQGNGFVVEKVDLIKSSASQLMSSLGFLKDQYTELSEELNDPDSATNNAIDAVLDDENSTLTFKNNAQEELKELNDTNPFS